MSHRYTMKLATMIMLLFSAASLNAEEAKLSKLETKWTRHGVEMRKLCREVNLQGQKYAVKFRINNEQELLGTCVSATGLCVAKASLSNEYVSTEDHFEILSRSGDWEVANYLDYLPEHDLVIVQGDPEHILGEDTFRIQQGLRVGQWLITINIDDPLPQGIGVLGAMPREIFSSKGYLGMSVEESDNGLQVTRTIINGAAALAGLKSGDRIMQDQSVTATKRSWLSRMLRDHEPGDWLKLYAKRKGELLTFDVQVGTQWTSFLDRQSLMNRFGSDVSLRKTGFESVFQHDTLIHPDDCGGPLVNLSGELVGVNIARAGRTDTYAIPIAEIRRELKIER